MSNPTICRAKNKATCRVHGVTNATAVILSPSLAASNLIESKKACDLASNLEELSEAKQLLAHDQKAYDATSAGRHELFVEKYKPHTFAEELEIKRRFEEAVAYRKEIIENNPVLKPGYEAFKSFVEDNATQSFVFDNTDDSYNQSYRVLREVPYGTPVAIKTLSGSIIYDGAGDGLIPGIKRDSFFSKLSKGSFVRAESGQPRHSRVSLQNSSMGLSLAEVAEVHVLKDGAFSKGVPEVLKTSGDAVTSNAAKNKPSVWAVSGDGYYYQIQGSAKETWKDTKKSEPADMWQEHPMTPFVPYRAIKTEQIDIFS
jgi:hypothetical protein